MKKRLNQKYFYGGTSESEKIGIQGSFAYGEKLNIFDEPSQMSILPKTVKVSGATVADLIKWIVPGTPHTASKYFYGDAGKIYREESDGTWSLLQNTSNSGGQGMDVYDDYLYYTQDTQIGRYGALSGTPSFEDDWQTGLNDTSGTNIAPVKAFKDGLAVGHGNYLGWWDGSTWDEDMLVLPEGLQIRSLEVIDEFLVIGTWRGTAITDNEEGYIFLWDGASTTYNFFKKIPEGGINAMSNTRNRLLSVIGSSGNIFINYNPFENVQQIPKMTLGTYCEVLPGAMTNWKNNTYIGVSGNSDNTTLKKGVYSWGSKSTKYPEVLNFSYQISTGNDTGNSLKIGAVEGIGDYLYISWLDSDGTTYGVDKVTNSGDPYAEAKLEALIFDNEQLYNDKLALTIKAVHFPLVAGESIQLGYKTNRADGWTTGDANSTVGSTKTILNVPPDDARFLEFQTECIMATSGTTSPTVTYFGMEFDDLKEEEVYA